MPKQADPHSSPELSIVIPLSHTDDIPLALIEGLSGYFPNAEILLAEGNRNKEITTAELPNTLIRVSSANGRATQMNAGGKTAKGRWLWFVHSDSRIPQSTRERVNEIVSSPDPQPSLYYFKLGFLKDGPALVKLNEWGTFFRSRFLKLPFGDQGFLIRKTVWEGLEGFPEGVQRGEDHFFLWRARHFGIHLRPQNAKIYTSARRYRNSGWVRTTLHHLWLTLIQAWAGMSRELFLRLFYRRYTSALAVFVKTPGRSPIKTRLSESTSQNLSTRFYDLCVMAIEALCLTLGNQTKPYWAIAEEDGLRDRRWKGLSRIFQGTGDLGHRLHAVYQELLQRHGRVILIGADCPQLTKTDIEKTLELLNEKPFVLGPARDGGFYLFAGRLPLPKYFWTQIKYSQADTLFQFSQNLTTWGDTGLIDVKTDVDCAKDLKLLKIEVSSILAKTGSGKQRIALEQILEIC